MAQSVEFTGTGESGTTGTSEPREQLGPLHGILCSPGIVGRE
jgi:hypothetical protein